MKKIQELVYPLLFVFWIATTIAVQIDKQAFPEGETVHIPLMEQHQPLFLYGMPIDNKIVIEEKIKKNELLGDILYSIQCSC